MASTKKQQTTSSLTPVTGCPALSSSDEEEEEEEELLLEEELGQELQQVAEVELEQRDDDSAGLLLFRAKQAPSSRSQANLSGLVGGLARVGQPMPRHRLSDHEAYLAEARATPLASGRNSNASSLASVASSRPASRQQQQPGFRLPTAINITAPSPMGSVRDVARLESPSAQVAPGSHSQQANPSSGSNQDELAARLANQLNLAHQLEYQSSSAATMADGQQQDEQGAPGPADDKSRSQLIDELLRSINDDSFNEYIDFNNKLVAASRTQSQAGPNQASSGGGQFEPGQSANSEQVQFEQMQPRPRSAMDATQANRAGASGASARGQAASAGSARPRTLNLASPADSPNPSGLLRSSAGRSSVCIASASASSSSSVSVSQYQNNNHHHHQQSSSTFDNVIRRMSTNLVQNFAQKMSSNTQLSSLANEQGQISVTSTSATTNSTTFNNNNNTNLLDMHQLQQTNCRQSLSANSSNQNLRREKSSASTSTAYAANSLYVDNQVPARRHSDNTINVPRIQVALSSPQAGGSRTNLNQRASASASRLANKWKTSAKTTNNQKGEACDKLSPNLGGALSYMRRHSSGNTTDKGNQNNDSGQSNGLGAQLLNVSPFKVSLGRKVADERTLNLVNNQARSALSLTQERVPIV